MKRSRPGRNRWPENGFTLIEVMMVVAIIGLTLTMGLPAFLRVLHREGMRKAEYDVMDACREARRSAIMDNHIAELVIHPLQGTIEVPGSSFTPAQLPAEVQIETLGVNFIESKNFGQAVVHFFANGTSDEFTILLHSSVTGNMTEIDLDTIAGLPVIKDIR